MKFQAKFVLHRQELFCAIVAVFVSITTAHAETRPHYGGTLRVMMESSPASLDLPANASPVEYWDLSRTLSLIGDTLVTLDPQGRPQPALATAWQSDASSRRWEFTLRRGVKFHDGSDASPAAIAPIVAAGHPGWNVHASASMDSISIELPTPLPSLLAELALPRNLLFKPNKNDKGFVIGTGAFLIADWQPGRFLKIAANENSWAGRPFVDFIAIEFGKSLPDQSAAFDLGQADLIEVPPAAANGSQPQTKLSSLSLLSLPVELLVLVFNPDGRAQDRRVREALAFSIDRKPIQTVLLQGSGSAAASLLPNWMTGYSALFSTEPDLKRSRSLIAALRQPPLTISYDPRDPPARLIAERIALDAREVGITLQLSLSGVADLRLVRIVLPSPDPATSLLDAARQLGLPQSTIASSEAGNSIENSREGPTKDSITDSIKNTIEDLYRAESSLVNGYEVIPLFHLPVASEVREIVRDWQPDLLGRWSEPGHSLADVWLTRQAPEAESK